MKWLACFGFGALVWLGMWGIFQIAEVTERQRHGDAYTPPDRSHRLLPHCVGAFVMFGYGIILPFCLGWLRWP